jgi:hypothetical protein
MKTSYGMRLTHEGTELVMSEKIADTIVAIHGVRGKVTINTFIIHRSEVFQLERPFTTIRLAFTPLINNDDSPGWDDCAYRGVVRMHDMSTGVKQPVEQVLVPHGAVYVSVLDFTDMSNGGAPLGRRVVRAMLRWFEALLEHSRRSVRHGFSNRVRDRAIQFTHQLYGQATAETATLLGTLHWPLLLEGSDCGTECLDTIGTTTELNPARYLELADANDMDVEPLVGNARSGHEVRRDVRHELDILLREQQRAQRDAEYAAGRQRAVELMRSICGADLADQFATTNCLVLEHEGYEFTFRPDGMIQCRDPNGKQASLCIHTRGFCCHPVDEIIIAYLNIRNRFRDFMRIANVYRRDRAFRMPGSGAN